MKQQAILSYRDGEIFSVLNSNGDTFSLGDVVTASFLRFQEVIRRFYISNDCIMEVGGIGDGGVNIDNIIHS